MSGPEIVVVSPHCDDAALGEPLQPWQLPHAEPRAAWERSAGCYRSQFSAGHFAAMIDAIRSRGGERLWGTTGALQQLPPSHVTA